MTNRLCHSVQWSSLGNLGGGGWVGLILNLVFWVGLLAGLTLLVVLALRRGRIRAAAASHGTGQPTAKEALQAQYARGEVTRDQYELKNIPTIRSSRTDV